MCLFGALTRSVERSLNGNLEEKILPQYLTTSYNLTLHLLRLVNSINKLKKVKITWKCGMMMLPLFYSQDSWIDISRNVSHNQRKYDVKLSPYGNYTFRVLARNKMGLSQPSLHSKNVCRTMEDIPEKNPENVIGEGDEPDNLVIYWTVSLTRKNNYYASKV